MPGSDKKYKYEAFISYSHQDKAFAKWLHKSIENYNIPKSLREKYPYLPKDLKRSVFRDEEELAGASTLSSTLRDAIEDSKKMIVLCSVPASCSAWINKEINYFKQSHENHHIFAIIKEGEVPEVFPPDLYEKDEEPLAIDAQSGRKMALMKIIAAILEIDFADVWQREKRESKKRVLRVSIVIMLFMLIGIYAVMQSLAISSNKELNSINSEIDRIEYKLKHHSMVQEEAYGLSERLKRLEDIKKAKEESLKWFGLLHTSVSKKAKEAYDKKGADAALVILESVKSLKEDEVYAKKNMLRAKLYIEKNDFTQATRFYEKAILVDGSYDNVYDYALFLTKQNALKRAQELYEKLKESELTKVQSANVLNRLGILYRKLDQEKEAEDVYLEALALRKDLARANPALYKNDLAWTYNNLGVLYNKTKQTMASEEVHFKALALRKSLMQENPKKYRFNVSCSLHNLGELYGSTKQQDKAEAYFLQSLLIRRDLIKENPKKFTPALGWTLNELAFLYSTTGQELKAQKLYVEALGLRRMLFKENPNAYRSVLMDTLNGLAMVYMKMGKPLEATQLNLELLGYYNALEKSTGVDYSVEIKKISQTIEQ
jgi:tetratricopeptide (TPR) repeat protein